ncbi:hypothetical protein [Rhodopseudomonas sp.]|uniref:hypothetical protein n=1 Tax=Rhodopseudomonas sp. TaxID=1078 RepID=UPI003B3AC4F8
MTDAAPKIRTANIPPNIRIVRLRSRLMVSANKIESIAEAWAHAGLQLLADELEQEAKRMIRAAM